MPLTSQTLTSAVTGLYTAKFPTCVNAKKSGKIVPYELLDALCTAWCDVLQYPNLFQVIYTGVTGVAAAVSPPVAFTFTAISAAVPAFIATSAWTGTASAAVAASFLADIPTQSSVLGLMNFLPVPVAGPGTGAPSPSIASSSSVFVPMFQGALSARLAEKVGVDGTPLFNLATPQLAALITNLSNSYATIVASISFVGAFAGSPTVPVASPLSLITSGSIV